MNDVFYENKYASKLIGKLLFNSTSVDAIYMMQLLIEKLCIPEEIEYYLEDELCNYILSYLNENNIILTGKM